MLTKLTGCRTSTFLDVEPRYKSICKTCDILGGAISGPLGHILNKFGRGLLYDFKAMGLMFRTRRFFMFSLYISSL